jgi:hypothetical protein
LTAMQKYMKKLWNPGQYWFEMLLLIILWFLKIQRSDPYNIYRL